MLASRGSHLFCLAGQNVFHKNLKLQLQEAGAGQTRGCPEAEGRKEIDFSQVPRSTWEKETE